MSIFDLYDWDYFLLENWWEKQTERVRELKERFSQNVLKLNQKISLLSVLVTKFNYLG